VALPGWFALAAVVATSGLVTILAFVVLSSFAVIASRSTRPCIPKIDSGVFIETAVSTENQ
jgi:hypothetical protein